MDFEVEFGVVVKDIRNWETVGDEVTFSPACLIVSWHFSPFSFECELLVYPAKQILSLLIRADRMGFRKKKGLAWF